TLRRPHNYRAVSLNLLRNSDRAAEQACATIAEFAANGFQGRRTARRYDGSDPRPVGLDRFLRNRIVSQPEAIAIFGCRRKRRQKRDQGKDQEESFHRSINCCIFITSWASFSKPLQWSIIF